MRHNKGRGVFVISASTELSLDEHQALKRHAAEKGTTIQKILLELLQPIVTPRLKKPIKPI
ncbi:hypothetical protein [Schlesneria sp. DSM 10557]|uniref:hypothetical protein n=1 Tax=Schlesneria sp. DSM 10557 TaxID=3044399 RepID=UPI00359F94BC